MELKSLEDWVLEKQFKSVPNVVDVSSFGGITREYQVRVDPDKLVSYGLTLPRWNSNSPTTMSMREAVSSRPGRNRSMFAKWDFSPACRTSSRPPLKTKNGTAIHIKDIGTVTQGPKIRLGKIGKAIRRDDGTIIDDDDVVEGIVLFVKAPNQMPP